MAKQVWTDNLTDLASTPAPEPTATGEFTLGQGKVGETPLSDRDSGIFAFIMLLFILLTVIGGVIYDKKKRKP